tara:strand:- start:1731 stop:1994 length:264 start_codon:yes stop_codon:yes gene_type:complete
VSDPRVGPEDRYFLASAVLPRCSAFFVGDAAATLSRELRVEVGRTLGKLDLLGKLRRLFHDVLQFSVCLSYTYNILKLDREGRGKSN